MLRDENPTYSGGQALPAQTPQGAVAIGATAGTPRLDQLNGSLCTTMKAHRPDPVTQSGEFHGGWFQFHGVSDLGVCDIGFGRRATANLGPETEDERIGFVVAARGSGQLLVGRKEFAYAGHRGVVFSFGRTRTLQFAEDCEAQAIALSRRKVMDHCAKLLGRDVKNQIHFDNHFQLDTPAGQNWLRLLEYGRTELSNPSSFVRNLDAARQQLENLLITGFLLGHTHDYSEALLQPQSSAAPYYVKRAEAYIEAHFSEPLSLADIAAHAGVSARSLQNGFQSFRGMTPMAFLRSVRLQHVHRALKVADPTVSTVTEIALLCGFTHLGEFATLYKRTFGVTPRQTLLKTA